MFDHSGAKRGQREGMKDVYKRQYMSYYCASKWGDVGLAKSLAHELAPHHITVNTLHPTAVDTDIITGMAQAADMATEDLVEFIRHGNALPVKLIDAEDVANAALWLSLIHI